MDSFYISTISVSMLWFFFILLCTAGMDKKQEQKHLVNLPCPICARPIYFNDRTLRNHLEGFHRRVDIESLIKVSKEQCGTKEE